MKGKWKAYCQYINDKMQYIAGRQLDISKPLYGGNVEYVGTYNENKEAVDFLCDELNSKKDAKNLYN